MHDAIDNGSQTPTSTMKEADIPESEFASLRFAFESTMAAPPFEWGAFERADDGGYKNRQVQIAWFAARCGFRAAWNRRSPVEAQPCAVAGEARFDAAMQASWQMVDPLNPAGQPGSYYRGEHNGIVAALKTVRDNWNRLAAPSAVLPLKGEVPTAGGDSTCSDALRQQGKPYPRTCVKCGLGPCVAKRVGGEGAAAPSCDLCERGFPLKEGDHYGTQSLGMIPTTRCAAAPVETEQPVGYGPRALLEPIHPHHSNEWLHMARYPTDSLNVPLYARPTPAAGVPPDIAALREKLHDLLGRELGDSYDCTRVWSAWGVGTMGEDDFTPVGERTDEIVQGVIDLLAARPLPGGVPTGLPTEAIEDAASVLRHIGPQLNAEWAHRCARAAAALSAGAPSSQEPTDAQMLDWLEAWHGIAGKPEGYGDTGIAYIDRVSDGFMLDDELGGGTFEKLRDALRAAMKESPHG